MLDDVRNKIIKLCRTRQKELGLDDEVHNNRLLLEIKEIDTQIAHEYFYDLYEKQAKFAYNENNLLVAYLLGLTDDFDINSDPTYIQGDMPDIDSDFNPIVRDYLKNEWAIKQFGEDKVCAIGNYTTFGIKSSLIDMARVHGKDRGEILKLTTKLGLKDDDGKALTWERALEQHPDLAKYCEENPDVADAARRLLHRNRGMGVHAGGLIISNTPIDSLVPLVRGKDGQHVSAFVEGLHGTDLGPLGLIKFDLLVITNLMQIAIACKLIKERHNIESICALPGQSDWSDTTYLNDPEALVVADEGKLKCIFQFDSDGIRRLVRSGGVGSFDDLVAYASLYRPGPMGKGMHDVYVKRKRGQEEYELHPILQPILGSTYGVLVFQEQILKILNVVGKIPEMHTEIVRKAISKKKAEIFGKYKDMFVSNGQKVLGWSQEQVEDLWDQIAAFAEYGFNKSHAVEYSVISSRLLWLKTHYPLEFFTAILSCEKEDSKVKEYKQEAEEFGVPIKRVCLNKSKVKFAIVDETIYMGFSNIKGMGEEIAEKVVSNQPYSSFEDFLHRFGTDAKVVKPLIALRLFDGDPLALYEYYEYYKAENKKFVERTKRYETTRQNLADTACDALKRESRDWHILEEIQTEGVFNPLDEDTCDILETVIKKYNRSKNNYENKNFENHIASFEEFAPSGNVPDSMKQLLCEVPQVAESEFYGFSWDHLLESSPDYQGGWTFSEFDEDETKLVRACEVHIVQKPKKKTSKKGTTYYDVIVEDANSRSELVRFWEDDYERFQDELEYWEGDARKGNFVSMRLKKPSFGFRNYTFDAPSKQNRWKEIPKDKDKDHRMIVLARPTILDEFEKVETTSHEQLISMETYNRLTIYEFGDNDD
ncbi:MAG: hypothetical protein DWQ19_10780 [Crenarchaeota archaeon]|nr:MAG: hypothetical protein DWQ19_10780 [Thermoproteota archaeon]